MAFIATTMTRERGGRFDSEGRPCRMERQSPALNVLGTLALWTGWFFFNASGVRSFSAQPDAVREYVNIMSSWIHLAPYRILHSGSCGAVQALGID